MPETSLKKLAAKLTAVGGKKQLDSKDLDLLREIKDGITGVLQGLKECDVCGAAVAEIVRLEIDGVRAAVCQPCGIKSLKNKSIVIRSAKKREAAREKPGPAHAPAAHKPAEKHHEKPALKHKPFKTLPHAEPAAAPAHRPAPARPAPAAPQTSLFGEPAEKPAAADTTYEELARDTGAKIMLLKKIQQLAAAVAFPMSMDRTASYVRMEAQGQGLNLQADEIRTILTALAKRGLAKIKE